MRIVDLYLNESLFQIKGIRSKNTFLPAFGGFGRRRFAGVSFDILSPAASVAISVAATMTKNTIKKNGSATCDEIGGIVKL